MEEDNLKSWNPLKKLSPTELRYMELIWKHPEGISSEKIYKEFPKQAVGTKSTILCKITEKGYAKHTQEGRHHIYVATITKVEYQRNLIKQQLKKSFGYSSFSRLIANFCGKSKLTEKQIDKLNQLLEELENDVDD